MSVLAYKQIMKRALNTHLLHVISPYDINGCKGTQSVVVLILLVLIQRRYVSLPIPPPSIGYDILVAITIMEFQPPTIFF